MKHPLLVEIRFLKYILRPYPMVAKKDTENMKSLFFDRYYQTCLTYLRNRYDETRKVTNDMVAVIDALVPFITKEDEASLQDLFDEYYGKLKD